MEQHGPRMLSVVLCDEFVDRTAIRGVPLLLASQSLLDVYQPLSGGQYSLVLHNAPSFAPGSPTPFHPTVPGTHFLRHGPNH